MTTSGIPDLRQQPFFASLPKHEWLYLQRRLEKRDLPAGAVIVEAGERGDFYAIVSRGLVSLETATGGSLAQQTQQTIGQGGVFGEAMLRYGVPSSFVAKTLTPCTVWVLRRSDWLAARNLAPPPALERAKTVGLQGLRPVVASLQAPRRDTHQRRLAMFWALAFLVLAILSLGPALFQAVNRGVVDLAFKAHRPDLATHYLQLALSLQPHSAILQDTQGYAFYLRGDFTQAQAHFLQAVEIDAEQASAQNNLGVTLLALGKALEAIPHLQAATTLDPGNARSYYNLGNAYLAAGFPQEAAQAYQRAFTLDPAQLQARAYWAGIALEQGKISQAQQAWKGALAADPNLALARSGLGAIAVLEGRPAAALPDLTAALQIDPDDASTNYYLGLALEALSRPVEAYAAFERALALSQDANLKSLALAHLNSLQQQLVPGGSFPKGGAGREVP